MKYSIGMSNSGRKNPKRAAFSRGYTPTDLSRFKNFKRYSNHGVSNRKTERKGSATKDNSKMGIFKQKAKKALYVFIGLMFFLGCVVLIGVGIYLKNLQNSLPSPNELVDRASDQSTQILDKDGEILYTVYGDKNREFVSIDKSQNIPSGHS